LRKREAKRARFGAADREANTDAGR